MHPSTVFSLLVATLTVAAVSAAELPKMKVADPRHISNGFEIPGESYCDQPYIVRTDDGAWLCVMTTAKGQEGASSQHVIAMRSRDRGRTWTDVVDVEPGTGPEASYAVLLKVPGGRIYCFYNHNTDNVREVKREDGGVYTRVDSLGHYVFKYSDDGGRSWSANRYEIPIRAFEWDRKNVYGGKLRFFWNVGRPLVHRGAAIIPHHKVAAMGRGFFAQSEGAFLRSPNLLTERDPEKITWETLPDGDVGLRTPEGGGRVAEEQSITELSDGSLYCVYRSIDGYPVSAYSRDGGRTWTKPQYKQYTPGGRRVKHPRAANFVWRCGNGKYLYWFHNHGGAVALRAPDWDPYRDRNPVWICAGEERDSPSGKVIHWSQPEILLYDDDPIVRMSYPDLVEEDGKYYLTETQKHVGRVHEIDNSLLNGLFNQSQNRSVAAAGKLLESRGEKEAKMPRLPVFLVRDNSRPDHGSKDTRAGFSLDLWLRLDDLAPGQTVLDSRDGTGRGIALTTAPGGALTLTLCDGRQKATWTSDPGQLQAGKRHHIAAIVDGGPKIISFVIDGVLHDGGEHRQFGWGRFSPTLQDVNGSPTLRLGPDLKGRVELLRIYNRYLRTSEAVGNYRAG